MTLTNHIPSDLATSTRRQAERVLHSFNLFADGRPLTVPLLGEWREHLHRKRIKPSTANLWLDHTVSHINRMRRAGEDVPAQADVTDVLTRFKVMQPVPEVLSLDQLRKLAEAARAHGTRTGHTVLALIVTGARRSEASSITPRHLRDDGLLLVGQKTHRERVFPWHLLGDTVRQWFELHRMGWKRREWDAIRASVGMDCQTKTLRSTWVTAMYSGQIHDAYGAVLSVGDIAYLAGHSLQVAERSYKGTPFWGLTGDTVPERLKVADLFS